MLWSQHLRNVPLCSQTVQPPLPFLLMWRLKHITWHLHPTQTSSAWRTAFNVLFFSLFLASFQQNTQSTHYVAQSQSQQWGGITRLWPLNWPNKQQHSSNPFVRGFKNKWLQAHKNRYKCVWTGIMKEYQTIWGNELKTVVIHITFWT